MEYASDLLAGMVAFITGGTSGINLGIAEAFANRRSFRCGCRARRSTRRARRRIPSGRRREARRGITKQTSATSRRWIGRCSSSTRRWVRSTLSSRAPRETFGRQLTHFPRTPSERWLLHRSQRDVQHVPSRAPVRCAGPGASMIAITAPQGTHPMPMQAHACAAKAGVNMLVQCLALEWGTEGTRVNAISPGPIAGTEGASERLVSVDRREALLQSLPLGRFGEREEIARAALFLASGLASYTTGHVLDCEGGLLLGDASAVVP